MHLIILDWYFGDLHLFGYEIPHLLHKVLLSEELSSRRSQFVILRQCPFVNVMQLSRIDLGQRPDIALKDQIGLLQEILGVDHGLKRTQLVHEIAESPYVHFLIITLVLNTFRGQIIARIYECLRQPFVLVKKLSKIQAYLGRPKTAQFEIALRSEKNILRANVPVHDLLIVQVLQSQQQLQQPFGNDCLTEIILLLLDLPADVISQVALLAVLLDEVDAALLQEDIVERDDIGMADGLHQANLGYDAAIGHVELLGDEVLTFGVLYNAGLLWVRDGVLSFLVLMTSTTVYSSLKLFLCDDIAIIFKTDRLIVCSKLIARVRKYRQQKRQIKRNRLFIQTAPNANNYFSGRKMEQLNFVLEAMGHILSPRDKNARETAEETLAAFRTSHKDQFFYTLLAILAGNYQPVFRTFAAVQLRVNLCDSGSTRYVNLWDSLLPSTHSLIQNSLFSILYNEADFCIQRQVADALGEIAASVLNHNPGSWPQFRAHVWGLFGQPGNNGIISGMLLMQAFMPLCPGVLDDNAGQLYMLFESALGHSSTKVRLSCMRSLSAYLTIINNQVYGTFRKLIPGILKTVYELAVGEGEDEAVELLAEMLDNDHKFFRPQLRQLLSTLKRIHSHTGIEQGIKKMIAQMLTQLSERSPTLFRKHKELIGTLIGMVFDFMVDIEEQIPEQWRSPAEGFNQETADDENMESTRFGTTCIDRVIYSIGEEQVLPILSEAIKQLLKNSDWRYQYTALMALSQIGEYIKDIQHIDSVVEMILEMADHHNPMIRYATCHALGQISDDSKPDFQQHYGIDTYGKLVSLLRDPVPRVVSHAAAALTNFIEGVDYADSVDLLDQMMGLLVAHASGGISLVKESCLGAVSSVAEMCGKSFSVYMQVAAQLVFTLLQTHKANEYRHLRGQALETITIIARSVGANHFRPALGRLMDILTQIQQSNLLDSDPQRPFIMTAWQRLCSVFGQELAAGMPRVLPSLFGLVKRAVYSQLMLQNCKIDQQDPLQARKNSRQQRSTNTYQTQQSKVAINMLSVLIDQLKQLYTPYVEQTATLLCKLIREHNNQDVKQSACRCLPGLIDVIKEGNPEGAANMARYFMKTLLEVIEEEPQAQCVVFQLEAVQAVIELLGGEFLSEGEVAELAKQMLGFLNVSEANKIKKLKSAGQSKQGKQADQDETQALSEQVKKEQLVQVAISETIGMLFKTHPDLTLGLANSLMKIVVARAQQPKLSTNTHKFAIFMIDDMVEYLGCDRLAQHWRTFGDILCRFCTHRNLQLRQAACYGLGVYAANTEMGVDVGQIHKWLQVLMQAAGIPKTAEQKQKTYAYSRENAVSSIGKIIKNHGEKFNYTSYLQFWYSFMPIKHDKSEAIFSHDMLLDILVNQPQLLIGTDPSTQPANLVRTLGMVNTILSSSGLHDEGIKGKIRVYLGQLARMELFVEGSGQLWQALTDKEKNNLIKYSMS